MFKLITRFFAKWWRVRLYWKLAKTVLNFVRGLLGKRARASLRR